MARRKKISSNVEATQLQIKAFNKALSRADAAGNIPNDIYEAITDLIDPTRMTKSGYGKAGKKYLESLTPEELLAYGSDIEAAKSLIDLQNISTMIDIEGAKDPASLLWKMYQRLEDSGYAFDSDQVKMVEEGKTKIGYRDMAIKMNKYLHDENYGLADFQEWFDKQNALE